MKNSNPANYKGPNCDCAMAAKRGAVEDTFRKLIALNENEAIALVKRFNGFYEGRERMAKLKVGTA